MSVLATELDVQGLWIHRKHETMGDVFTHIPDAVEHARKYFNKTNRILIQQLKDSREAALAAEATAKADTGGRGFYLLGSDFTAADIVYVHCLGWSKEIGWDAKWKDDATLKDYIDLCRSRPAYSRLLQSMGEKVRQNKSSNL